MGTAITKEVRNIVSECESIMRECGFKLPPLTYRFNGRLSRALARCNKKGNTYAIEFQTAYFMTALSMGLTKDIKQTILHEMCHALPNGFNHGAGWRQYTTVVNRKFGFNIRTLSPTNEAVIQCRQDRGGTAYRCECCGSQGVSSRQINLSHYHCKKCGGKLVAR